MSENHTDCGRFEAWLLEGAPDTESQGWIDHLESCSGCREQWATHQMLVATFAEETVPELSQVWTLDCGASWTQLSRSNRSVVGAWWPWLATRSSPPCSCGGSSPGSPCHPYPSTPLRPGQWSWPSPQYRSPCGWKSLRVSD